MKTFYIYILSLFTVFVFSVENSKAQEAKSGSNVSFFPEPGVYVEFPYQENIVFKYGETDDLRRIDGQVAANIPGFHAHANRTEDTLYFVFNQGFNFVFLISNASGSVSSYVATAINDTSFYFLFSAGVYDVFASKNEDQIKQFYLKEQKELNNNDTVFFEDALAQNDFDMHAVDAGGHPLIDYNGVKTKQYKIFFPQTLAMEMVSFEISANKQILFTDFSDRYRIFPAYVQREVEHDKIVHIIQYEPQAGIQGDLYLDFDPGEYVSQMIRNQFDPFANSHHYSFLDGTKWRNDDGKLTASFSGFITEVSQDMWDVLYFYTPDKAIDTGTTFILDMYNDTPIHAYLHTEPYFVELDSLTNYIDNSSPVAVRSANGQMMDYGRGMVFPNMLFGNFISFNNKILAKLGETKILGMYNENRITNSFNSEYFVKDMAGDILQQGAFRDFASFSGTQNSYKFEILNQKFLINDEYAFAKYQTTIDFSKADLDPPLITSLKVLDQQKLPQQNIRKGENASIQFSCIDAPNPANLRGILQDSCQLKISLHDAYDWINVPINKIGNDQNMGLLFEADISFLTSAIASYDLELKLMDSSYNFIEYILQPAFNVQYNFVWEDDISVMQQENECYFYPNPATDKLYRTSSIAGQGFRYSIFVMDAKLILTGKLSKDMESIDVSQLKKGEYFIRLESKGKVSGQVFIKQ
jgi:type IX secretion system substrate protein